jgi:threonine dehydrogenase-like Zn-dependent dehydrogenase
MCGARGRIAVAARSRPAIRKACPNDPHESVRLARGGHSHPSLVITHRPPLEKAPEAYKTFPDKADGCIKVVLKP